VFTHAVANAPWTYPSHASLFTGLLPSEHRMETPRLGLAWARDLSRLPEWMGPTSGPENQERLAERWLPRAFSDAGYETVCVSNNPWIGRLMGMSFGFEHVRDTIGAGFMPTKALRRMPRRLRASAQSALLASRVMRGHGDMLARDAVDWARAWLDRRDRSRPFFLFVNLLEAHYPYLTPEARRGVREAKAGPMTAFRAMQLITMHRLVGFNLTEEPPDRPALELLWALHRHSAVYLDRLLEELTTMAAADGRGTVVCVTADHGEEFGQHHALAHMFTLDEPALHIPLVLSGDGLPAGERSATVGLWQVYRTLLSAAEVATPEGAGPSLLDAAREVVVAERERIEPPPWASTASGRARDRIGRIRTAYRDPWKLLSSESGTRLFDLSSDPEETTDVASAHPELVAALRAALPDWPEYTDEQEGRGPAGSGTGLTPEEEAAIQDQLAALGYLE
jgi:arylsulfatase A-like enzyme